MDRLVNQNPGRRCSGHGHAAEPGRRETSPDCEPEVSSEHSHRHPFAIHETASPRGHGLAAAAAWASGWPPQSCQRAPGTATTHKSGPAVRREGRRGPRRHPGPLPRPAAPRRQLCSVPSKRPGSLRAGGPGRQPLRSQGHPEDMPCWPERTPASQFSSTSPGAAPSRQTPSACRARSALHPSAPAGQGRLPEAASLAPGDGGPPVLLTEGSRKTS